MFIFFIFSYNVFLTPLISTLKSLLDFEYMYFFFKNSIVWNSMRFSFIFGFYQSISCSSDWELTYKWVYIFAAW